MMSTAGLSAGSSAAMARGDAGAERVFVGVDMRGFVLVWVSVRGWICAVGMYSSEEGGGGRF